MYLELFGGLTWLLLAGDILVRGAAALARRARIPPMVVGLTIVAFGTSAPELCVSVGSALRGYADLAVGNVVGSNIANVLLVLGVPAAFAPAVCDRRGLGGDLLALLAATALFIAFCLAGTLGRVQGAVLCAGIVAFLWRSTRQAGRDPHAEAAHAEELERVLGLPSRRAMIGLFLVLGCLGLPLGAWLLVDGAAQIAAAFGVPPAVIGVSVVAIGTSLPELATTVVAALHGNAEVALGNVVGSNVFNLLAIMGITAVVAPAPLEVPAAFLRVDLWVMLGAALLLAWLAWVRQGIGRPMGMALAAAYVVYLASLVARPEALAATG